MNDKKAVEVQEEYNAFLSQSSGVDICNTNHLLIMDGLKNKLNDITLIVPAGSKVIYFDYPLHFNVGDQLIYLGTLEFFKTKDYKVEGYYSEHNCDLNNLPVIDDETIVLFHGGGNFGDLYGKHQVLREKIVTYYKNNRIVVLPQTIYFKSDIEKEKSAAIFKKHQDLHIYARDQRSYNEAKLFSDRCYVMPDMAQYLWGTELFQNNLFSPLSYDAPILFQDRIDFESLGSDKPNTDKEIVVFDWYELIPRWSYFFCSVISLASKLTKNNAFFSRIINSAWKINSEYCIRLSANKLNKHSTFVTTRLHGHIFAQLISHPNTILDNNYGKIRGYADLWTIESDIVTKGVIK